MTISIIIGIVVGLFLYNFLNGFFGALITSRQKKGLLRTKASGRIQFLKNLCKIGEKMYVTPETSKRVEADFEAFLADMENSTAADEIKGFTDKTGLALMSDAEFDKLCEKISYRLIDAVEGPMRVEGEKVNSIRMLDRFQRANQKEYSDLSYALRAYEKAADWKALLAFIENVSAAYPEIPQSALREECTSLYLAVGYLTVRTTERNEKEGDIYITICQATFEDLGIAVSETYAKSALDSYINAFSTPGKSLQQAAGYLCADKCTRSHETSSEIAGPRFLNLAVVLEAEFLRRMVTVQTEVVKPH